MKNSKDKSNKQIFTLEEWAKSNQTLIFYNSMGGKVEGFIKKIHTYEILIINKETKKEFLVFKSNIFYIEKKGVGLNENL